MWRAEQFAGVEEMVAFLNGRGLRPEHVKVAVGRGGGGGEVFHLLYEDEDRPLVGVAVAEAEVPELAGADLGRVVDEAEAIIAEAQREDPEAV